METASMLQSALVSALDVARSLAPAGVTIRRWRDFGDYEAMVAIFRSARPVDGTDWEITTATLTADVSGIGLRPENCILIAEQRGRPVGWARMFDYGISRADGRILTHSGYVHPESRRRGIGRALLAGVQTELNRIVEAKPSPAGMKASLQTWVYARNASTIALLEADGYRAWRYMIEMTRPIDRLVSRAAPFVQRIAA